MSYYKKRNEIGDEAWLFIVFPVTVFIGLSVMFGLMHTADARMKENPTSGCEYKSYASRFNPFYRGTCELFRDKTTT